MLEPQRISKFAAIALFSVVCGFGLFADLFSKWLAFEHGPTRLFNTVERVDAGRWTVFGAEDRRVVVVPHTLHFHATVNEGAVFGLGQGQQAFFVAVSIAAILFLLYLVTRTRSRFEIVLLGCLLAGVLGNMYDRIRYSYVRDMILALPDITWPGAWQLPLFQYPGGERLVFPYIFNIADCLLVCGVAALLVRSFFATEQKDRPQMNADERGLGPQMNTDKHR